MRSTWRWRWIWLQLRTLTLSWISPSLFWISRWYPSRILSFLWILCFPIRSRDIQQCPLYPYLKIWFYYEKVIVPGCSFFFLSRFFSMYWTRYFLESFLSSCFCLSSSSSILVCFFSHSYLEISARIFLNSWMGFSVYPDPWKIAWKIVIYGD